MTTHSLVLTAMLRDRLLRAVAVAGLLLAVVGCAAGCVGLAILTLAAQVNHR